MLILKVIEINYEYHDKISMCDFMGYQIYDKFKNKCSVKELKEVQEKPIMVSQ